MEQIVFNFDVIKNAPFKHLPTNEFYVVRESDIERVRNVMHPIHPFIPKGDETVEVVTLALSISGGKKTYTLNEHIVKNVLIDDLESVWIQLPKS